MHILQLKSIWSYVKSKKGSKYKTSLYKFITKVGQKLSTLSENKNIAMSWAKFGLLNENEWYIDKYYALRRDHNPDIFRFI